MFISKTMRTLALTILLVPMAAQSMPSMRDYVVEPAKIFALSGGLVTFSLGFLMFPKPTPTVHAGVTTAMTLLGGIIGGLIGYDDYKTEYDRCSNTNERVKADFKRALSSESLQYFDQYCSNTFQLQRAYADNPEAPISLAAQAGAEEIFDALIAKGFKATKEDYKILWNHKLANLKAKEDAAINATLKAKTASVKKEIEATTARTAVIEKRVAAKKVEIELKALKDQLASNKANQLKNGPIKTAYESVMASQARAQYNACNPSDAYTPWALSESERKNYNASAKSPRAKGLVKE